MRHTKLANELRAPFPFALGALAVYGVAAALAGFVRGAYVASPPGPAIWKLAYAGLGFGLAGAHFLAALVAAFGLFQRHDWARKLAMACACLAVVARFVQNTLPYLAAMAAGQLIGPSRLLIFEAALTVLQAAFIISYLCHKAVRAAMLTRRRPSRRRRPRRRRQADNPWWAMAAGDAARVTLIPARGTRLPVSAKLLGAYALAFAVHATLQYAFIVSRASAGSPSVCPPGLLGALEIVARGGYMVLLAPGAIGLLSRGQWGRKLLIVGFWLVSASRLLWPIAAFGVMTAPFRVWQIYVFPALASLPWAVFVTSYLRDPWLQRRIRR